MDIRPLISSFLVSSFWKRNMRFFFNSSLCIACKHKSRNKQNDYPSIKYYKTIKYYGLLYKVFIKYYIHDFFHFVPS